MARLGGFNARDIRSLLQGKHDPDIIRCLTEIAERQDHLFGLLETVAHAMDQLANGVLAHGSALNVLSKAHTAAKDAKAMGVKVASENPSNDS